MGQIIGKRQTLPQNWLRQPRRTPTGPARYLWRTYARFPRRWFCIQRGRLPSAGGRIPFPARNCNSWCHCVAIRRRNSHRMLIGIVYRTAARRKIEIFEVKTCLQQAIAGDLFEVAGPSLFRTFTDLAAFMAGNRIPDAFHIRRGDKLAVMPSHSGKQGEYPFGMARIPEPGGSRFGNDGVEAILRLEPIADCCPAAGYRQPTANARRDPNAWFLFPGHFSPVMVRVADQNLAGRLREDTRLCRRKAANKKKVRTLRSAPFKSNKFCRSDPTANQAQTEQADAEQRHAGGFRNHLARRSVDRERGADGAIRRRLGERQAKTG